MDDIKPVICKFCNGYYDFGSEQPVCSTCHAFLYEFCPPSLTEISLHEQKEALNDSGNEEPERGSDLFPAIDWYDASEFCDYSAHVNNVSIEPVNRFSNISNISARHTHEPPPTYHRPCPLRHQQLTSHLTSSAPVTSRLPSAKYHSQQQQRSLNDLPVEILLHIFQFLDDISLWTLRQVSSRCRQVVDEEIVDQDWCTFVQLRWPLFTPHTRVISWRQVYLNLMRSVTCRFCLEHLRLPILFPVEAPNLRYRRIVHEIKNLCTDPPFGIRVLALDQDTYSHCLAGIEGPPQSPYQGGLFHVHILVPDSYPIRPPVIRFLTRILHPNISFHGDVGMDCIQHNWSLALTLEKLLISVQSLLTDPYTMVCMEPAIGVLYNRDRARFEELAKLWTWKFACHDYLSADFVSSMVLPDYIENV